MFFLTISLIIILLLVIIYHYQIFVKEFINLFPCKDINNYNFKTGDIILTRCNYLFLYEPIHYIGFNLLNYLLTSNIETHAALVVNINSKSFIYNVDIRPCFDHFDKKYKYRSPSLIPLEKYLMCYEGEVFVYPTKKEHNNSNILQFIEKTKNKTFSINQWRWLNTIIQLPINFSKEYVICTHLVMEYLIFINLVNEKNLQYYKESTNPKNIKEIIKTSNIYDNPFILNNVYKNMIL